MLTDTEQVEHSNQIDPLNNKPTVIFDGICNELTTSGRRPRYFVITAYNLTMGNKKQGSISCYRTKKAYLKTPLRYQYTVDLNDLISIFSIDIPNSRQKYVTENMKKFEKYRANKTRHRQMLYELHMYTCTDRILIGFDDPDTRLACYECLIKSRENFQNSLQIFGIIGIDVEQCLSGNEISFLTQSKHGAIEKKPASRSTKYQLCYDDNLNDYFYLLNLNGHHYWTELKFHVNHIKRIGHNRTNQLLIELGKRSIYGSCRLALKCESYAMANYLHTKTMQFMDNHKRSIVSDSGESRRQRRRTMTLPTVTNPVGLTGKLNTSSDDVIRLRRHQTLFSFFNLKSKLKHLSLTKLTSSLSLSRSVDTSREHCEFGSASGNQYAIRRDHMTGNLYMPNMFKQACDQQTFLHATSEELKDNAESGYQSIRSSSCGSSSKDCEQGDSMQQPKMTYLNKNKLTKLKPISFKLVDTYSDLKMDEYDDESLDNDNNPNNLPVDMSDTVIKLKHEEKSDNLLDIQRPFKL